jgi:hypothetical protein
MSGVLHRNGRRSACAAALLAGALLLVAPGGAAPRPPRFDSHRALAFLRLQVRLGPRPAGSAASRQLAALLVQRVPDARVLPLEGGLQDVVGSIPGRDPSRTIVLGAHYDTKDLPGFVGADDGASGVAVLVELARVLRPRAVAPTVVFAFFDGEETPRGVPDDQILTAGLRGSRAAVPLLPRPESMVLLDMVGKPRLRVPREQGSDRALWARIRAAARATGVSATFPPRVTDAILDDHVPFAQAGIPSADLIDLDFPCWHRRCEDLAHVSAPSLAAVGATLLRFLRDS